MRPHALQLNLYWPAGQIKGMSGVALSRLWFIPDRFIQVDKATIRSQSLCSLLIAAMLEQCCRFRFTRIVRPHHCVLNSVCWSPTSICSCWMPSTKQQTKWPFWPVACLHCLCSCLHWGVSLFSVRWSIVKLGWTETAWVTIRAHGLCQLTRVSFQIHVSEVFWIVIFYICHGSSDIPSGQIPRLVTLTLRAG